MDAPGRARPAPVAAILAVFLLAWAFAACSDGEGGSAGGPGPTVNRATPAGESRSVRLGFSSLPPQQTSDAAVGAFATAAQYGDVVLIQRNVPWEDFLPGHGVSRATTDTTRLETQLLDQYSGLQRFYAIDPTDGFVLRSRVANLPASIDPQQGFAAPDLREAFLAYTAYVVKNYHPDYLALGVEINMLYERAPRQFEAFVTLYNQAYDVAKAAGPRTKVFPTFQLEDLEGRIGAIHPPHWEVLDSFRGRMDALAVSTYPFLTVDFRSAADIGPDYYRELAAHWSGEILIADTGYASAPIEGGVNVGTEEDQRAYLARLLAEAEANGFSLVVWFAALDPAFAREGGASVFRDVGLRKSDGSNKLAWPVWEEWARRPLR
ncbi:MAG: hypothetical protein IT304_08605 [Dehalococcoidia bacterium]|nr:hypothetical protein [Dehalococcoidia bacterium]